MVILLINTLAPLVLFDRLKNLVGEPSVIGIMVHNQLLAENPSMVSDSLKYVNKKYLIN